MANPPEWIKMDFIKSENIFGVTPPPRGKRLWDSYLKNRVPKIWIFYTGIFWGEK